uniref:Beta-lactamase-related domain-containing protein n=1 Tax=Mucochytrium quahogii TaxID=96639 RepID=A0A7S2SJB2_9STRA|mmetsp:Transcript_3161/g.4562  ORF Transcript_3161/g.4562 Transcript_3161/m.4562 type:complete len:388 (+) Transcript_3161:153-1316(+)|eukprot:CAMPEP_0203744054 /NCGR_PEP_ID=MMETSP0098-20131031/253_1 /ASSEMBLY_ACC=CAM_ASM_000208 /TAXON_ID=96639 /ORGANISM=" , Strain NY0313808BC1" /LENGTH=387 /DNA_ID=CAMNT_0050631469 /DNA_START=101 /DNA_END=1264 /DNA_ORIENTATION=-
MDTSAQERALQGWLKGLVDNLELPCCYMALYKGDKCVFKGGAGNGVDGRAVSEHSRFHLYSMTKPIVSVAAMILVEKGKLDLQDPIYKFLGDKWKKENQRVLGGSGLVPCEHNITVKMLLNHTSGIGYPFLYPKQNEHVSKALERDAATTNKEETAEEVTDRISTNILFSQPGSKFTYGHSTDVLARLIEVLSGETIEHFLKSHIFDRIGMRHTGYAHDSIVPQVSGKAWGKGKRKPYPVPVKKLGGTGLVGTVEDYALFARMILNGGQLDGVRIISKETVSKMTRNQLPLNQQLGEVALYQFPPNLPLPIANFSGSEFGLGFRICKDQQLSGELAPAGTLDWCGLGGTTFFIDPTNSIVCIFLTNVLAPKTAKQYWRQLQELVYNT